MATFLTPQGDLYNFDLYDGSNPNFNLTVVGTSGCGKSAMYSQILCGTLSMNALVTITDVGMDAGSGSYRSLCSLVGETIVRSPRAALPLTPWSYLWIWSLANSMKAILATRLIRMLRSCQLRCSHCAISSPWPSSSPW